MGHTTIDLSVVLTASFMTQGLVQRPDFGAILDHWDGGNIELNYQLIQYAEYCDGLYQAGRRIVDGAGVFDYEVSEEFGHWFGTAVTVREPNDPPPKEECCDQLKHLAFGFFIGACGADEVPPVEELQAALDAVQVP